MEKKIGIVTLHGYYNYGNRLQNYALKYFIDTLGFESVTTVIEESADFNKISLKDKIKNMQSLTGRDVIRGICNRIIPSKRQLRKENQKSNEVRTVKFKEFSDKYLNEKFYLLDRESDRKILEQYSFFVSGSDQVWNPVEYKKLGVYFLTFIENKKRISYAPSISRDELPTELNAEYKAWLEGMSKISIREEAGAKIIKKLTNIDAPVLVDPTMLLSKEEWLNVSIRAKNRPDEPYLLTYFLGGPSDKTRKKITELAKERNMKIINLGDITEKATYETGPSEFLDYINHASAFFTDSFHGVVFSILFETPFIVYERDYPGASMYSRIETILENFDLKGREAKNFSEDIYSVDFTKTDDIISKNYNDSRTFLKDAFGIEE